MNKHLLSAGELTAQDITRGLDTAAHLAKVTDRAIKKVPTLRGRTVCNLFFEDSTRTRISFELAAKRLSADVINFSAKGSSVSKGESLKDTAITLEAMGVDAIVIRHGASGAPWRLAEWVQAVVVNAGDGTHEHPTQALLDLYTMRQRFPSFDGLKVAIVGDVLHSRVARSNVLALTTMGAEVTLVAPPTLLPARGETWGAAVSYDLDAVLPKQDVVMMLRVQLERQRAGFFPSLREYARLYGLDGRRLDAMADPPILIPPGPMNRGGGGVPTGALCREGGGGGRPRPPATTAPPTCWWRTAGWSRSAPAWTGPGPRSSTATGWPSAPAWSTCTCTCASRAARTPRRSGPGRGRPPSAATRRCARWPTPTRWPTTPGWSRWSRPGAGRSAWSRCSRSGRGTWASGGASGPSGGPWPARRPGSPASPTTAGPSARPGCFGSPWSTRGPST